MLKSLQLKNFRGFKDHRVDFQKLTLLVGSNNAGKTTIIEALRIVSIAQSKAKKPVFVPAPEWLVEHSPGAGFRLKLDAIGFEHRYAHFVAQDDEPAQIIAKLSNNNIIVVSIGPDEGDVFCQLKLAGSKSVVLRSDPALGRFHATSVMPPIGQLNQHEGLLNDDYVRQNLESRLSHRHFRNQLRLYPDSAKKFVEIFPETWSGIMISGIVTRRSGDKIELELPVRDGPFTSEAGWVGSGLQAWLQMLWFLVRSDQNDTIVLDEPDVYLHADIQRKLIKFLGNQSFRQVIVATHSVEIISDVSPESVVIVQKRERASRSANSLPAIQHVLDQLGTIHNIQLAKLAHSQRVLFVEGKDFKFLSEVAYKIGVYDRLSRVPCLDIGGKGNWKKALGAAETYASASQGKVKCFLILDRDYSTDAEISETVNSGIRSGLQVHFWKRKEIENYFLDVSAIQRYVENHSNARVDQAEIQAIFQSAVESCRDDCLDAMSEQFRASGMKSTKAANSAARERIASHISSGGALFELVSGKEVFSLLTTAIQTKFGVSFGPHAICRELLVHEIPAEMRDLVRLVAG